jgi:hypothetical protein
VLHLYVSVSLLFSYCFSLCRHDTAVRVVMPKYYGDSEAQMSADFAALTAAGCAFTVAGRLTKDGAFRGLKDIQIPDILRHVGVDFKGISEEQFRMDISSTQIREALSRNGTS